MNKLTVPAKYRRQLIHASRMTAAGLGAYALVHLLGLSGGLWAMITAIVVTQSSVGGSLKFALDQAIGSMVGAIYATAVVLLISPVGHVESVIAFVVALAPLAFLSALYPGYRAAPTTGMIMLLAGTGLGLGPVDLATGRVMEVALGCLVGVVISVLIVPAHASRSVVEATAKVADLMALQLRAIAARPDSPQRDLGAIARRVRETMLQLERLVVEAARERRALLTSIPDVEPLLRTTSRLRLDVNMLRRAAREAEDDLVDDQLLKAFHRAMLIGAQRLERIGAAASGAEEPQSGNELQDAVRQYRHALEAMRESGATRPLSTSALTRLFGINFALDQFRRNLADLEARYEEVTQNKPSRARF